MSEVITAADLVGCTYRRAMRLQHPDAPATDTGQARACRSAAARAAVLALLPAAGKNFRRLDIPADSSRDAAFFRAQATLEALAAGAHLITGAYFEFAGFGVEVEALVRQPDAEDYTPVIVSSHRVARRHEGSHLPGVPTHRLGLSAPLELPYKLRHHSSDGYRLALAARALQELGLDSGTGGAIGQDRETVFFVETAAYQEALDLACARLAAAPQVPRRVKECASCRFWPLCEPQLRAVDDISLFLPGDRARRFREQGINTVSALADAALGEPSALAAAWQRGEVLLRRPGARPAQVRRADVEVDIDMEAYLDQGAYLWGALHEGEYRAFATWSPLGGAHEAQNFAEFFDWLMGLRATAHAAGKTFAAYCYSAHGENHWMLSSARRFGYPEEEQVQEFIASPEWVDLFVQVKQNFAGPQGLGLKLVAPVAGHSWPNEDIDGETSVDLRRQAVSGSHTARQTLLDYNEGDVRATRAVREWMTNDAPGVAELPL